ncbi:MAG: hypothetical protein IIZ35_00070, partial [Clostridia bacterium]|nr:hypothetical protein [Clostridia bacterium]
MTQTFAAVSKSGVMKGVVTGSSVTTQYTETEGSVGWLYASQSGVTMRKSMAACAQFEGTLPDVIEPAAADASEIRVKVKIDSSNAAELSVGILTEELSTNEQTKYSQLRQSGNVVGTISAGSTSGNFTMTHAQAVNALAYGVKVFTATEFGTADSRSVLEFDGTEIVYTADNPAARGSVSALSPAPYSNIVRGEAQTISYRYRQAYGGYRQAYLSV